MVTVDTPLLNRALQLYQARPDKNLGNDGLYFDQGFTDAVTADKHFVQAGYQALLLERSMSASVNIRQHSVLPKGTGWLSKVQKKERSDSFN